MFETSDGRIRMTLGELSVYQCLSGLSTTPATMQEFTNTLLDVAAGIRERIAAGQPRPGDNTVNADLIFDFLSNPHEADLERRHRDWRSAGAPIGEEAMRRAGLTSPALDRVSKERAMQPDGSTAPVEPAQI